MCVETVGKPVLQSDGYRPDYRFNLEKTPLLPQNDETSPELEK